MSTIYEIRRDNLRRAVNEKGATSVAKLCGYASASYISQMAGRNPTRPITEDNARKFEKALGMQPGSLDIERDLYGNPIGKFPPPVEKSEPPITLSTIDHRRFALIVSILKQALDARGVEVKGEKFASLVTLLYDDFAKDEAALRELADRLVSLAT